jgi:hypothetical protein
MDIKLHYDVLNNKRFSIVKELQTFKNRFYLAGGTGLALQIGHRISEDFDFFTNVSFKNDRLNSELHKLFPNYTFLIIQNEENTFTCMLNGEIKLSFFKLGYENIFPLVCTEHFNIANILEIGIMKVLALPRASYKDYVDLYYIMNKYELCELMSASKKKHDDFNEAVYLKCLLSFQDLEMLPIHFTNGFEIESSKVFAFIEKKVKLYIEKL